MKIETEPRDDHQVRLVVEFEPEVLEKYRHQAARKLAKDRKIPGFRPGKAPYPIVLRHFGAEAINEEAVELMIDEVYPEVLKEADIKPGGPGSIEELISLEPPKFAFLVPLETTVDLADWREIREEYTPPQVSDEDVDKFITDLRRNYGTLEAVERPAEEEDLLYLTISGEFTEPAEGEDKAAVPERPLQILIHPEDNQFPNEYPFLGFGRELIGLSAEDEKTIVHTYPEDAANEAFKGKTVEFKVKVNSIKRLKLPEVNDEFAAQVGGFENVDALNKGIREHLEREQVETYDRNYFTGLIDKIRAQATIKYAPQAVAEEIKEVLHNTEHRLEHQNMDLDTYLKTRQMTKEEFVEQEVRPAAIDRLERGLILDEVSRVEEIKLDAQRLQEIMVSTMTEAQADPEYQKQNRSTRDRIAQNLTYEAAATLMNQQIMDRIKVIATGQADAAAETIAEAVMEPSTEASQPAGDEQTETVQTETTATEPVTPDEGKKAKGKRAKSKKAESE